MKSGQLMLCIVLLVASACTAPTDRSRPRSLAELRLHLGLSQADWDDIVALASLHSGYIIRNAARVSNNTVYVNLEASRERAGEQGPTLVMVKTGDQWTEHTVIPVEPTRAGRYLGPPIR